MTRSPHRRNARELARYHLERDVDGLAIEVKCYIVPQPSPHIEIHISSHDNTAVVDVAPDRESSLPVRIEQAVRAFAAAAKLRNGQTP